MSFCVSSQSELLMEDVDLEFKFDSSWIGLKGGALVKVSSKMWINVDSWLGPFGFGGEFFKVSSKIWIKDDSWFVELGFSVELKPSSQSGTESKSNENN